MLLCEKRWWDGGESEGFSAWTPDWPYVEGDLGEPLSHLGEPKDALGIRAASVCPSSLTGAQISEMCGGSPLGRFIKPSCRGQLEMQAVAVEGVCGKGHFVPLCAAEWRKGFLCQIAFHPLIACLFWTFLNQACTSYDLPS